MQAAQAQSVQASKALNALKVAGVGLGVAMGTAVYKAVEFESQMARVRAITGASESDFAQLEQTARQLGETTSFSASEAAAGMEYLAMAGYKTHEIIAAMPGVLNLAKIGNIDLATSADIASNILSGFGMKAAETSRVIDVMAATITSSNTNVQQLGDAMKYAAPVASTLGWTIEETAAAIGIMSNAGIQGSQAGTSLRMTLLQLSSPSKRAADKMKELGINTKNANGEMKSAPELIKHISERLEGLTQSQKVTALAHMVGTEAASGFINIINAGPDALAKFTKELEASEGAAKDMAGVMDNTAKGSLKAFQSALEGVGIKIGNELLPTFRRIVDAITDFVRWFGELDTQAIASVGTFTLVTGGMIALLNVVRNVTAAMRALAVATTASLGPWGVLVTVLSTLVGMWAASSVAQKENTRLTLNQIDAQMKENQSLREKINRYEVLRSQTKLTNDELKRYLDLQSLLKQTSDPKAIEDIRLEMEVLEKRSGLTNKEFKEMLALNSDLAKKFPDTGNEISNLGNKLVTATDKLREMNSAQREMLKMETMAKLAEGAAEYEKWLKEINRLEREYNEQISKATNLTIEESKLKQELLKIQDKIAKAKKGELNINSLELHQLEIREKLMRQSVKEKSKEAEKQRDLVKETEEELKTLREKTSEHETARRQLANILLLQNGINLEAGKGLKNIQKRIEENEKEIKQLEKSKTGNIEKDKLIQEQIEHLREQNGILDDIIDQVSAIGGAHDIANKKIDEGTKKAKEQNKELSKPTKKPHDRKEIEAATKEAQKENAELNKKTKKPHDKREIEAATKEAQKENTELNKKTKKPHDYKEITAGKKEAENLTKEANKSARKPFDYSAINNALRVAQDLHNLLARPVQKSVRVIQSIFTDRKHHGGIVKTPRYHTGTAWAGGPVPGVGEVQARLLGGEMVLTRHHQAKLFNFIRELGASYPNLDSGSVGGRITREDIEKLRKAPVEVSLNIDGREMARVLAEPMDRELYVLQQQKARF